MACHTPETVTFAVGLLVWIVKKKLREILERIFRDVFVEKFLYFKSSEK